MPILDDLIDRLTLLETDRAALRLRGFSDDIIDSRKWKSCEPNNARVLADLLDIYGLEILAKEQLIVPHRANQGEWVANPQLLQPKILIPYMDVTGGILAIRPHKGGFKGAPSQVYQAPGSYKGSMVCIIAESEFKAVAAECYGYAAIGIPGITTMSGKNWDYFEEIISGIKTEEFVICFDTETKDNPEFPHYKADWRKRYDTIIYAYAMCQKILNSDLKCRIASLPLSWMENGKVDIDLALKQKKSLSDFKRVIDSALSPKEYYQGAPIPLHHQSYVNRRIKKFFFIGSVAIIHNCFYALPPKEKPKELPDGEEVKKEKPRKLSNCSIRVQNIYEEVGTETLGLQRDLVITDEYGLESKPILITPNSMSGRVPFITWLMSQGNYLFFGKDSEIVGIWEYIFSNDDGNIVYLLNRCGYIRELKFYLFKNLLIKNDIPTHPDSNGIFWIDEVGYKPNILSNGESMPEIFPEKQFPMEQFTEYLADTTDIHTPGLAKALIAWYLAVMFLEQITAKFNFFPLLFLHGTRGSGKTTIIRWLNQFFGLSGETTSLAASSPVGITRLLSYYASLPLVVDDWRDDVNSKRFTTLFLGVYNRQVGAKGVKAKFGLAQTDIRAALAILGEEMISDNGLATRCVSFYIPMERRVERLDMIEEIIGSASQFTHEVLTTRAESLRAEILPSIQMAIEAIRRKLPKVEMRLVNNYGILLGAYNAVIGRKDTELYSYIIQKISEGQHEMSQGDKLHKFAEEFLFGIAENLLAPHHYKFTGNGRVVILWIKGICDVLNKYYNRNTDSSLIITKHFTQQSYFLRAVRVSFKGAKGKFPAIELDVSAMPESIRHYFEAAYGGEDDYVTEEIA